MDAIVTARDGDVPTTDAYAVGVGGATAIRKGVIDVWIISKADFRPMPARSSIKEGPEVEAEIDGRTEARPRTPHMGEHLAESRPQGPDSLRRASSRRNLAARCFDEIERLRRASKCDTTAKSPLADLEGVAVRIWLRFRRAGIAVVSIDIRIILVGDMKQ